MDFNLALFVVVLNLIFQWMRKVLTLEQWISKRILKFNLHPLKLQSIDFIGGNNDPVNKIITNLLRKPFVGCASLPIEFNCFEVILS